MTILSSIIKRVERRVLREVENASVKKIKASFFGEKEEKVILSRLEEYRRCELACLDYLGYVEMGGKKDDGKKLLRDLVECRSKLIKEEKDGEQEEVIKKMELAS